MAAEGPRAPRRGPPGLLLLILSSVGAGLELSVVSPVTVAVGSDALLECTYTVESPSVNLRYLGILWLFKESHLLEYGPVMKVFHPRASINESEIPNGKASLLLSNVKTSDEGPYTCSIIYTPKKEQKTVTLNIQVVEEKGVNAAAVVVPLLLLLALVAVLGWFLYRKLTRRRLCKIAGPDRWMVGEPVTLVCVGHHWPKDTEIMWLKIQGGKTTEITDGPSSDQQQAMQPLLSKNNYRVNPIEAPEGGGSNLPLTTKLQITPSLEADEGATFKCIFTPKDIQMKKEEQEFTQFKLYGVPRTGDLNIVQEGNLQVLTLNVTDFYPENIRISWSCNLPGKEGRLPSKGDVKSKDGTYSIESRCKLTEVMICKIGQTDINVSIEHESQTEPIRVAMRLDHNGKNWCVVKL